MPKIEERDEIKRLERAKKLKTNMKPTNDI